MNTDEPRFHVIQPLKDPESNWAVDVAKNLEEYLIKICSGEFIGDNDDPLSINFAEAALMLQGSVQVYSRKVEYLYTLVLHALEFLSQKSQQDQTGKRLGQSEGSGPKNVVDDENEPFLDLDDVPVETKNSLDDGHSKDDTSNLFVKPPANLVVLEGDCFDSIGDVGELESYLLATHDLYRDFILLDPCDAGAVDKYLGEDKAFKGSNVAYRGTLSGFKTRKSSFQTPTRRSGGGLHKSPLGETLDGNLTRTPEISHNVEFNDYVQMNDNIWPDLPAAGDFYHEDGTIDGYPEPLDESDDDDDPWKPLNPHEPGNSKVKPFKKVKNRRRQRMRSTKLILLALQLPVARLHGTINPDFKEIWEAQRHEAERVQNSQSLYEKLRQSLDIRGNESDNPFTNAGEENENIEDENDIPDFWQDDFTMPEVENTFMDAEGPPNHESHDGDFHFSNDDVFQPEDGPSHASLEDLCRSHLDSLLASIAETEKQTELATRVSTWKQRIESTLEEQDSHPPFDIHEYGTRVLDKLSLEEERGSGNGMSFANVVNGQEKHDVARTFSALLQLVNNRNVDLGRGESDAQSVCYTAVNPFYVRLLNHVKRPEERKFGSRKRVKSPLGKHRSQGNKDKIIQGTFSSVGSPSSELNSSVKPSRASGDFCVKLGKTIRCTPEGKRRRRSRLVEAVDMQS